MRLPEAQNELHRRFRRRVVRGALTLVAIGVLGVVVGMAIEIPFAPWIRSFGLWSTLTGTWQGRLKTVDGRTTFAYFDIAGGRGRHGTSLYGTARWCDVGAAIRDYRISGDSDNWRGTRFHLSTSEVVTRPDGVGMGDLQGERRGDDIRATGLLASYAPTASAEVSRGATPEGPHRIAVRYELRRGGEGEFLAACNRQSRSKKP